MSDYYKPITLSRKHKNLNWVNGLVHLHDMQCMCNEPLAHTIDTIVTQEPNLQLRQETQQKLQKCLTTGEDHTTADVVEDFGDGELEALFAGDDIEDDTG